MIAKITSAEFEEQLKTATLDRNPNLDVEVGPIRDTVVAPVASVLEPQNDRIRRLSLIMSLLNVGDFTENELDEYAFNEQLIRSPGTRASGTVFFQARIAPGSDLVVPINFPVATVVDPTLGRSISFRTVETQTLPAATAALYFNASTSFYELEVSIEAVAVGQSGNVGPGRITQMQTSLPGFDYVTNRVRTINGADRESNERFAERLFVAIAGTDISTPYGLGRDVDDLFSAVLGAGLVFGQDPLLTRATTDSGAVDVYLIGESLVSTTESHVFLGVGQAIVLNSQPVRSIASVDAGGPAFIQGVDYELVKDTGDNAGSNRAQDAVVFLAGGTPPAIGTSLNITYNYNALPGTLQAEFVNPDRYVFGRDVLFKEGTEVEVEIAGNISFLAGTNSTTGRAAAISAIVAFINGFGLDDDVEQSDVNAEVRKIAGIDNLVFTTFRVIGSGAAPADILIAKNEYARTTSTNVVLTVV